MVEVSMKGSDADRAAGTKVFDDRTGLVRPDALAVSAQAIAAYVAAHSAILGANKTPCRPGAAAVSPDGDGVTVRTNWSCTDVTGRLKYRSTVLIDIALDARQVVLIGNGVRLAQDLLDARRIETPLTEVPKPLTQMIGRYLEAGIEQILLGCDYAAFLVAILLWVRRIGPVIQIFAAYAVASSITLSLGSLALVRVPSAVMEPAIAASIFYVAAKNFLSRQTGRRWREAFCFGLIHGFGFAVALRAFGLASGALVPALAAFNIGLIVGQTTIVALIVPGLLALDRMFAPRTRTLLDPARPALVVYATSGFIACLGGYWLLASTVLSA